MGIELEAYTCLGRKTTFVAIGDRKNNAASWKLVSVPCKNLTFTVNFTLSVSDLEDAWK